jgi:hypothetical protein
MGRIDTDEVHVEPSGWYAVQLRYAYLSADESDVDLVEDRVILVDGTDEEAALGRAVEMAPDYEDDYETDAGAAGVIRFEGIVAIKELDDPPAAGAEVWHEFMDPDPSRPIPANDDSERLPPVYPEEMAFPRARDD